MKHDLNDLRIFVEVAQAGGYAKASRSSGVPRATLSRRISALEADLGSRLIERSSRSFRLTETGQLLYDQAKGLVSGADEAFELVESGSSEPRGTIRFSVPPSLLHLGLRQMVLDFMQEYPLINVQIEATNRRVDLQREDFDFALRVSSAQPEVTDMVVVPLVTIEHCLLVEPRWKADIRTTLVETLAHVPPIVWSSVGQAPTWRLKDKKGKLQSILLSPKLTVEDMIMLHQAAVSGFGIAILPRFMVLDDLNTGRLLEVDLDLIAPDGRIHAIHLGQKGMRKAVRLLLDWLKLGYKDFCRVTKKSF